MIEKLLKSNFLLSLIILSFEYIFSSVLTILLLLILITASPLNSPLI